MLMKQLIIIRVSQLNDRKDLKYRLNIMKWEIVCVLSFFVVVETYANSQYQKDRISNQAAYKGLSDGDCESI